MVNIQIAPGSKRPWYPLSKGWWTGHVFCQDKWCTAEEIEQQLSTVVTAADLSHLLHSWNGSFALIWQTDERTFAAVDIARSIPLFWSASTPEISLTNYLEPSLGSPSTWQQSRTLVQTEFVPGHTTLLMGWQQLQAGELLEIHEKRCYLHNYFPHRRPAPFSVPRAPLKAQFAQLLDQQLDRLIQHANGREIVIPLSGGYDSRILLAGLHQKGYSALKAFTYGQADSWEVKIASTVAETLGVEWQFVPYTPELLEEFWSKNWRGYAAFAGNCTTIPQEQDFFALHQLKEQGWLLADSIICPGYCGDFQAGSYLPAPSLRIPQWSGKALSNFLYHRFIRYPAPAVKQQWQAFLPKPKIANRDEYISELEHWVLREYVSKFIINGVRAYEWFDCSWYLPLWDLEFIRFWQRVPNQYRENMSLYREVLREHWFEPLQLTFEEDQPTQRLHTSLTSFLPIGWKKGLKKLLPPKTITNVNGLHQLVPPIQRSLGWPAVDRSKSLNEMIGHWYHEEIEKMSAKNK